MRANNSHRFLQFSADDSDWLKQVRIVGDNHSYVEIILVSIVDQMCGKINVRALLLCLDHSNPDRWCPRWAGQWHLGRVAKEMAVVN